MCFIFLHLYVKIISVFYYFYYHLILSIFWTCLLGCFLINAAVAEIRTFKWFSGVEFSCLVEN